MKAKIGMMILAIMMVAAGGEAGTYGGGMGTVEDPYQIRTAEEMNSIGATPDDWGKAFILMADLDLSAYSGKQFNIIGSEYLKSFTGIFDGNGHILRNFTYSAPDLSRRFNVGLFGYIAWATIQNLGIEDISIDSYAQHVGGLVGYNTSGTITGCHVTGTVRGADIGGLVGYNAGILTGCWAAGSISGGQTCGGLVGSNFGTVIACFATGSVQGTSVDVGGLVGVNCGPLIACYSTSTATGAGFVGGLIGSNGIGTISACFWDMDTSGLSIGVGDGSSDGVTGKTTSEMKQLSTFVDAGWDFAVESANGLNDYWRMVENGYPSLPHDSWTLLGSGISGNPYRVENERDLGRIWMRPAASYRLMRDLDLSAMTWQSAVVPAFSGTMDGNQSIVSHLTIRQPGKADLGLFGRINRGTIRDIGILDADISGGTTAGCLAGRMTNRGTISGCFTEGKINGTISGSSIGGLVGNGNSSVTSCFASGSIGGTGTFVGGLTGECSGTMLNCYSTVSVGISGTYCGGLSGYRTKDASVTACFWDTEASGQIVSGGGEGKTTAEMKTLSTFTDAGWDFVGESANGMEDVWRMCEEGADYPRLSWEFARDGDFDCPDGVALEDLMYLAERWMTNTPESAGAADADGNGRIDLKDLAIVAANWMSDGGQYLVEYEVKACDMGAVPPPAELRFSVTVEGRYIHVADAISANCCIGGIELSSEVGGDSIILHEWEIPDAYCFCICTYPTTAVLGPFEPGTYTLTVIQAASHSDPDPDIVGTVLVTIE